MKSNRIFSLAALVAAAVLSSACGHGLPDTAQVQKELPAVGTIDAEGIVTRARALITINPEAPTVASRMVNQIFPSAYAATGQQTITVVNAENVSFTLDASQWLVPSIKNEVLDFGSLSISGLFDNNLRICGSNGKQKCNNAVIRIYTAGVAGAGVWNSADGYGMPIASALVNTSAVGTVGLGTAGAVTLQTQSIANGANTFRQTDFAISPRYNVKSDFNNAGAGSYSTTLIIEYGLAQ